MPQALAMVATIHAVILAKEGALADVKLLVQLMVAVILVQEIAVVIATMFVEIHATTIALALANAKLVRGCCSPYLDNILSRQPISYKYNCANIEFCNAL